MPGDVLLVFVDPNGPGLVRYRKGKGGVIGAVFSETPVYCSLVPTLLSKAEIGFIVYLCEG